MIYKTIGVNHWKESDFREEPIPKFKSSTNKVYDTLEPKIKCQETYMIKNCKSWTLYSVNNTVCSY